MRPSAPLTPWIQPFSLTLSRVAKYNTKRLDFQHGVSDYRRRFPPVIITLKRQVTFQAPDKPGTVPEERRHWGYNNDPHFAVSHQQDDVSSEDSDL